LPSTTPRNLLHMTVDGVHPPPGEHGRWMPAFAGVLSERHLAELVTYIRSVFSRAEPWKSVEEEVRSISSREREGSGSQ
jgi:mono/diheme cytochrome c family protein